MYLKSQGSCYPELLSSQCSWTVPTCLFSQVVASAFLWKAAASINLPRACNSRLFRFKTDTVIILCRTSQPCFLLVLEPSEQHQADCSLINNASMLINRFRQLVFRSCASQKVGWIFFSHQLASFCQFLDVDITSNCVLKTRVLKLCLSCSLLLD